MKFILFLVFIALATPSIALNSFSDDGLPDHLVGDVGLAIYATNRHLNNDSTHPLALPYAFVDYKRFFARIDEIGIKTYKMGYGYLELTGKITLDSYQAKSKANGSSINRSDSLPVGIGTYQETPIGTILANAFHDFGKSNGALYELLYFAEIETKTKIKVYPQVGIERQSRQYANYYYGITSVESASTGYSNYAAPATNNLIAGMMVEIPVIDNWHVNIYGKRKWMGGGINNSPITTRSFQDNFFMALTYRFK